MSGLFVFFSARHRDGTSRINNAVFPECGPIATLDDIAELQRHLERQYDYQADTVRIQHWQRMEIVSTKIEGQES